jgi:hypothetical protein
VKEARKNKQRGDDETEFRRFENLTKNLLSVSNIEVREKMEEEKRKKKSKSKRKAR